MESELIKQTFKLGNSAGVILPVEWKDKKVKIQLVEKSITKDIIEILEEKNLLKNTLGIYLAGSYARGEETESSDIDILVITDQISKQIKEREYEIVLISKKILDGAIKKSIYLASLVKEAKAILNEDLLKGYKNNIRIKVKGKLDEIKSVMRINEKAVEIDRELGAKVSDNTMYSIILRLRELYLIECLLKNKLQSKKEFLRIINKIASEESYNAYLRVKNDQKAREVIPVEESKALISYVKSKIKEFK